MKKLLALLLALLMLLSLAGCGKQAQKDEEPAVIELTLWTFPAGDWGDPAAVETLLTQFNSVYPDIHVTVQCLDEATGDDKLSTAVDGGRVPRHSAGPAGPSHQSMGRRGHAGRSV